MDASLSPTDLFQVAWAAPVSVRLDARTLDLARNRMLRAWRSLPEDSPEADRWIRKAGPDHYAEHLPRLREWVSALAPSFPFHRSLS